MPENKENKIDDWEQFDTDRADFYRLEEIRKKTPEYQATKILAELLVGLAEIDDGTFLSKEY